MKRTSLPSSTSLSRGAFVHLLFRLCVLGAVIFFLASAPAPASAQMAIRFRTVKPIPPDSADLQYYGRKHFWRAAAEVGGFNLGLWAFDRYVQHGDWSYISWNTIKRNFREGFKWDNDNLGTNTFLHPYNGNLYFNAGRSNGFNFWQSELFAIAGSSMWEMCMENEYPSTNDIIATPVGGAVIGETLFRASDAVLDDRTTGADRFERELACFILSPMRGITRLVSGDMWRHRNTSGRIFGTPGIALRVSAGVKLLEYQGRMRNTHVGFAAQIDMEYGDRFEAKSQHPYDYFTVKAELQGMKSMPVLSQLQIKGRLLSREFLETKRQFASVGLYQHFDFYDSDTIAGLVKVPYKLGIPASVGVGVLFRDIERRKSCFDAYAHANAVILGSVLSDHYFTDERCYNWASGFSIKAGLNYVFNRNRFSISLSHEFYRLFTWKGYRTGTDLNTVNFRTLNVQGDKSVASFNVTEARLDYRIKKKLYATLAFTNYARSTHYRDFPSVVSTSMALRLMLSYKL